MGTATPDGISSPLEALVDFMLALGEGAMQKAQIKEMWQSGHAEFLCRVDVGAVRSG